MTAIRSSCRPEPWRYPTGPPAERCSDGLVHQFRAENQLDRVVRGPFVSRSHRFASAHPQRACERFARAVPTVVASSGCPEQVICGWGKSLARLESTVYGRGGRVRQAWLYTPARRRFEPCTAHQSRALQWRRCRSARQDQVGVTSRVGTSVRGGSSVG